MPCLHAVFSVYRVQVDSELENGKPTLQIGKVLHCMEMLGIDLYAVNREDGVETRHDA